MLLDSKALRRAGRQRTREVAENGVSDPARDPLIFLLNFNLLLIVNFNQGKKRWLSNALTPARA
ncbi:MAG TPA: hypothetical protein VKX28_05610 [Xanthobacteraceae bacterium]|nr:hypothetical protein [Xanthobacteraceae bacterium]